jgi:hypothetical protein
MSKTKPTTIITWSKQYEADDFRARLVTHDHGVITCVVDYTPHGAKEEKTIGIDTAASFIVVEQAGKTVFDSRQQVEASSGKAAKAKEPAAA